ncbi:hypothetical protein Hanom_Chr00s002873g01706521 [Helianthus anomalus]
MFHVWIKNKALVCYIIIFFVFCAIVGLHKKYKSRGANDPSGSRAIGDREA